MTVTKEMVQAFLEFIKEDTWAYCGEEEKQYYYIDGLVNVEAALEAALAAMPGPAVTVKPLEWRLEDSRDADFPRWNAEWNGIVFSVFKAWWGSKSKWGFVGGGAFHHTEEAAKAAAQADYEARILSAITPAPDLASENERLRAALEKARDAIVRADADVLTDTLWMPEDISKGETVVDHINAALDRT